MLTKCSPEPDPQRVEQVFQWFLTGSTPYQIQEAIATTWPGQDPFPLIAAAAEKLRASSKVDADIVRGWCFEATRSLYLKMTEIGDFAGALRAVAQILKMAGRE